MAAKLFPFWYLKPPAYVCPEGEQVVNGGFETGDFTGWEQAQADIITDNPHSGLYAVQLYESWMFQVLSNHVADYCIQSFGFWARGSPYNSFRLYYEDGTSTEYGIDFLYGKVGVNWAYIDCAGLVPSNKKLTKIEFIGGSGDPWYIDDVTLTSSE